MEKDKLQARNLSDGMEKDKLQARNLSVGMEKDKLQARSLSDGIEKDKLQGANRFLYAFVDTVQDGIRVNLSIKKGWAGCNLRGMSVYGR